MCAVRKRLAKKGLKPEDSPYFNPITNPFGLPPKQTASTDDSAGQYVALWCD
jgi:hypothetical protein